MKIEESANEFYNNNNSNVIECVADLKSTFSLGRKCIVMEQFIITRTRTHCVSVLVDYDDFR